MTQAIRLHLPAAAAPSGDFIPLADAAALLMRDVDHLRRVCRNQYHAIGLARKTESGEWEISRAADPRLSVIESQEGRDLRQIEEAHRSGTPAPIVNQAIAKRDIIKRWFASDDRSGSEDARRERFVNRLKSDGSLAGAGVSKLSPRTLRDWVTQYSHGGVSALVRRVGWTKGENTIGTAAWVMFMQVMAVPGVDVTAAYEQVRGHIRLSNLADQDRWNWPALRTVQHHYKTGVPLPAKVRMKGGPQKFEATCVPKIKRNPSDIAAGEWLVGDMRTLDIHAKVYGERELRRVRLILTSWICMRSRKTVGWHIGERGNSDTVLSSFKMACTTMGTLPRIATIDNGTPYKAVAGPARRESKWSDEDSDRFQTAFEKLGIEVNYALPFHPWAKSVESDFRKMAADFDTWFVGYIGGSPASRPEDAEKWTRREIRTLPTVDDIRAAFASWLESQSSRTGHRGEGMERGSRNEAFAEFYTTTPRRCGEYTLSAALCRTVGPVKVGRDGVRFEGFDYGTQDLAVFDLQGEEVWIAVDPVVRDTIKLCRKDGTVRCEARIDRPIGATSDDFRERLAHQAKCRKRVKQYAPSRDYLLKTPHQQIQDRRRAARPAEPLPARPAAETVELVRSDIEASMQKVRKASGAETLRQLSSANAAAETVNERRLSIMDLGGAREVESIPAPSAMDLLKQLRMNGGSQKND